MDAIRDDMLPRCIYNMESGCSCNTDSRALKALCVRHAEATEDDVGADREREGDSPRPQNLKLRKLEGCAHGVQQLSRQR